jgi:nucleoside-diphosphate-sugar epimerase
MRVFVAGATGVIGRSLTGLLIDAGHEVTGMTRSPERAAALRALGAETVVCDAYDAGALTEAVVAARPEAVIHELTDIPPTLQPRNYRTQLAGTNRLRREGTRNVVAAARAAGATRLLAQSIAFAYEPSGPWVKDETAPLHTSAPAPMDAPIATIAELERRVLDAGGIVLRYGFLYGPGTQMTSGGLIGEMARKRRFPVIGAGTGQWSFVAVPDAAAATVAALQRGSPGVYNVVDDDPAPVREWLPAFAAAMGGKPPWKVPAWVGRLAGGSVSVAAMTTQRAASNAKAKRELGWQPRYASWRDGFAALAG